MSLRSMGKWIAGMVAAVVLAGLTAFASGLGDKAVDRITAGDEPLLSYSAEEQGWECGSSTFLPASKVGATRGEGSPTDWHAFQHQPGADFADSDVVQVSIQGESARKVTLTGIRFSVERRKRSSGAVFAAPCGGGLAGRGMHVDVEADPVRVISSSNSKGGEVYSGGLAGSSTSPIKFPWSVSISDPLLLYVVASARSCHCVWRAEIPWASGGKRGVIRIDNGGAGYVVVGVDGLMQYSLSTGTWQPTVIATR